MDSRWIARDYKNTVYPSYFDAHTKPQTINFTIDNIE